MVMQITSSINSMYCNLWAIEKLKISLDDSAKNFNVVSLLTLSVVVRLKMITQIVNKQNNPLHSMI